MGVKAPLGLRAQARLGSSQQASLRRALLLSLWQRVRSPANPLPLLSPRKGCQEHRRPSRPSGASGSRAFLAQHRETPRSPWDPRWGQELHLGAAEQGSVRPRAPPNGSSTGGLVLSFSWAWGDQTQAVGPPPGPRRPAPGPNTDSLTVGSW